MCGLTLIFVHSVATDRKFNRMSTSMPRGWGITSLRTWVYLGACSGPVARGFRYDPFWAGPDPALPRSVGQTAVAFPHHLTR